MEKIDRKPEKKGKTKTFLIDKELKTKDLWKTAERRASGSPPPNQNPPRANTTTTTPGNFTQVFCFQFLTLVTAAFVALTVPLGAQQPPPDASGCWITKVTFFLSFFFPHR